MQTAQTIIFCGGLLFAAVYDILTRKVSDGLCILIALAGLATISVESIFGAILGAGFLYIGYLSGMSAEGDITLCTAACFVLGFYRSTAGLMLSIVLYGFFVLGDALIAKLQHRPSMKSCPLAPFFAAGFISAYFFA